MLLIEIGNTTTAKLLGLKNSEHGIISDGVVNITIKDADGTNIAGETWPVLMTYQSGSNGDYAATLSADISLIAKTVYDAVIVATDSNGAKATWTVPVKAEVRRR